MESHKKPVRKGALFVYIVITAAVFLICGGYLFIDTYFPLKYEDVVIKYADAHGLDPNLVCGVIATESKFSSDTVSGKGAVGLMQIMPDTGEWVAGKLGIKDYSEDCLTDPVINIRIGTWYLEFLFDRYEEESTAIAAYNAGHGNVDEWLKNENYSQNGKTLYKIPFEETEKYVKKVERACEIYKTIYKVG